MTNKYGYHFVTADKDVVAHGALLKNYWLKDKESSTAVFIIVDGLKAASIIKIVKSLENLNYRIDNIHLVDTVKPAVNKNFAKDLGCKYISSDSHDLQPSLSMDIQKTPSLSTILVLAIDGQVNHESMELLERYIPSSADVVVAPLAVLGNYTEKSNYFHGTSSKNRPREVSSLTDYSANKRYTTVRLSDFSGVNRQSMVIGTTANPVDFNGLSFGSFFSQPLTVRFWFRHKITAAALLLSIISVPAVVLAKEFTPMNFSSISQTENAVQVNNDNKPKPTAQSGSADGVAAEDSNVPSQEQGPHDLIFTIKPGDTMSELISDYINKMHEKNPEISLARLGYAQDYLMRHYGYYRLPASQETFKVAAEDVLAAWDVAANADARADFWTDYARRAGVK